MAKKAPSFACRECGDTFSRWAGRCPSCSAMNSVAEITAGEAGFIARGVEQAKAADGLMVEGMESPSAEPASRLGTGMSELDRVLGGGLAEGGVVLIGGEPGIGKSTLLGQVVGAVAGALRTLYVTAEESASQVRERLIRLGAAGTHLSIAATGDAQAVAGCRYA